MSKAGSCGTTLLPGGSLGMCAPCARLKAATSHDLWRVRSVDASGYAFFCCHFCAKRSLRLCILALTSCAGCAAEPAPPSGTPLAAFTPVLPSSSCAESLVAPAVTDSAPVRFSAAPAAALGGDGDDDGDKDTSSSRRHWPGAAAAAGVPTALALPDRDAGPSPAVSAAATSGPASFSLSGVGVYEDPGDGDAATVIGAPTSGNAAVAPLPLGRTCGLVTILLTALCGCTRREVLCV